MAEGFAYKYLKKHIIKSAGTHPQSVNLMAIEVMNEIGINISKHYSKSILNKDLESYDIIITLCGDAKDECVNLSSFSKKHVHWDLEDPAKATGSHDEKLNFYRKIRNQIESQIKSLNDEIQNND